MLGISINIATAAMENIYERLCWLYATARSTLVCDAIGNSYPLSVLTELSENQSPYSERFVNQPDYEQKSILKDFQMKDVLCTRTTGIIQGRDPATIADLRDAEGNERFITREGVPIIPYATKATVSINKPCWESLGIVSSCLLSGIKLDHMRYEFLNPQTMSGVEIDFEWEEYQAWYQSFTLFQQAVVFQAQDQISDILRKSITDHKAFIEVSEAIELLVSMVEMAYGLQYKYEDHITALQLINAQWEKINSQANFAREQDQLDMIRILHASRVQSGNGQNLDLELFLDQLGDIFKPEEDDQEDDGTLQTAQCRLRFAR